jgi:hypothetical protein
MSDQSFIVDPSQVSRSMVLRRAHDRRSGQPLKP